MRVLGEMPMTVEKPLWTPSSTQVAQAPLTAFMAAAGARAGQSFTNYAELHAWSISEREAFWDLVWDFCGVIGDKGGHVLVDGNSMPGAQFYPDASLNFAQNLLRGSGSGEAIVFRGEDKVERRLTWDELAALVSRLQQLFVSLGVAKGDRIAAMMPNMPETVAAMLATASLGAVWSSCSPDFGEQGVLDRFGQIEPHCSSHPTATGTGKHIEVGSRSQASLQAAERDEGAGRRLSRHCDRRPRPSAKPRRSGDALAPFAAKA
jgi:acetoacetyl-CoA synthetase